MKMDSTILVTGAAGMVGGAAVRALRQRGHRNVLTPTRGELDLADRDAVMIYMERTRPQHVLMIGAKVGGIAANNGDPVGFVGENLKITQNLFDAAQKFGTEKNLFLGSSCIDPRAAAQPMVEESLLTGPLEPTNEGFALAKIVGLKLADYHWRQHKMLTVCPMPCNLYGTGDHYDFERSHVLSALVRRFVDAKDAGTPSVTLWGTGSPRREFMHVDDLVRALLFFMDEVETPEHINVGTGEDVSIKELAETIADAVDYDGDIVWDHSRPDGMPRKLLDSSKVQKLGFQTSVTITDGIARTIAEYRHLKASGGTVQ